jgi:mono/diheme cytochrome c family protein
LKSSRRGDCAIIRLGGTVTSMRVRTVSGGATGLAALVLAAACGSSTIKVRDEDHAAAVLFTQRCAGCHTLSAAGTEGASTDARTREQRDGPNFDARKVTRECALFAIRNGGFSGGLMPANIVAGKDAEAIADFLARYSGGGAAQVSGPPPKAHDCPAA